MAQRVLFGILLLLALLVGVSKMRTHPATPGVLITAPTDSAAGSATQGATRQTVGFLPGIDAASTGAPGVDMIARLAIRRRLEREGNRVYLDSLLYQTDSVLTRWADRPDRTFTVHFAVDTALPGYSAGARDDARAGMRSWAGNEAGIVLNETADSTNADIRVEWVASLTDSTELGSTKVTWDENGVIDRAVITLSIGQRPDYPVLPAAIRRRIAAHEFGHALGLPHSGSDNDLMFSSSPVTGPSRRDQATLLLLYAVPPGSLRVQ